MVSMKDLIDTGYRGKDYVAECIKAVIGEKNSWRDVVVDKLGLASGPGQAC